MPRLYLELMDKLCTTTSYKCNNPPDGKCTQVIGNTGYPDEEDCKNADVCAPPPPLYYKCDVSAKSCSPSSDPNDYQSKKSCINACKNTYNCHEGACIAVPVGSKTPGPYTTKNCDGKCTPIYDDQNWINDNLKAKSITWSYSKWNCNQKPLVYTNDNGQEVNLPLCPQINSDTPSPDGPGCYYPLGYTPSGWKSNSKKTGDACGKAVCNLTDSYTGSDAIVGSTSVPYCLNDDTSYGNCICTKKL